MPDDSKEAPREGEAPVATVPATPTPATVEDWETRFKYLLADFENFRRRADRDRETFNRQARGAILRDLLPILEAFAAARQSTHHLPASDPLRRGVDLLDREWSKFLKHQGVEPVAEVGRPFRSEEEEAVGESPARDGAPDGTVSEIVQQGYRYFGGLLRPAKVIVVRTPPPPAEAGVASPEASGTEEERS